MSDHGSGSDSFRVSFPCWILVREDCLEWLDGETARVPDSPVLATVVSDTRGVLVPVFTDDDLAQRFCECDGLEDAVPAAVDSHAALAKWLRCAARGGAIGVVFDPPQPTGLARRVWDITYGISAMERGPDL